MDLNGTAQISRRKGSHRKGDARELAILDAAEALLGDGDYERLTFAAIASEVGLSRGSLYFYFGSKQEVMTALVARTMLAITAAARGVAAESGATIEESIRSALLATERFWVEHGRVMSIAVELSTAVPEIGQLWRQTVDEFIEQMSEVLQRAGIADINGPGGAHRLARTMCLMVERNYYWAYVESGERALRNATDACELVWRAVVASQRD